MKTSRILIPVAALLLASCNAVTPSSSQPTGLSVPPAASQPTGLSTPEEASSEHPTGVSTPVEQSSQRTETSTPAEQSSQPAASSQQSSEPEKAKEITFQAPITAMNAPEGSEPYSFDFTYKSEFFSGTSSQVNLDFALFAYGMANASASHDRASAVYAAAGFNDVYDDASLSAETGLDTIGYAIGLRKMDGENQIVVSVRGEDYGAEWGNNLYSAPTAEANDFNGDHYGFHVSALKVIGAIRKFVNDNNITDAKYLFTGYSRGAVVAGLAAAMMIDDPIACEEGDVYAYTFESPAGMLAEHNKEAYNCIHNFLNRNDLIPMLMPVSFGYVRPGHDINIAEGLVEYDPLFTALGMTSKTTINENQDYDGLRLVDEEGQPANSGYAAYSFLLNILTRQLDPEEVELGVTSFHTKEEYRDNAMESIRYLIKCFFEYKLSFSMSDDSWILMDALSLLNNLKAEDGYPVAEGKEPEVYDPKGLSKLLFKFLESKGYKPEGETGEGDDPTKVYDKAAVEKACDQIQTVLRNIQIGLTRYYVNQELQKIAQEGQDSSSSEPKTPDYETARSMLTGIVMIMALGKSPVARHAFDTSYAVLVNYINSQRNA